MALEDAAKPVLGTQKALLMTSWHSPDVVVAGGGVAGASVAAALAEFGYRVLIVEPGIDASKRLTGELVHPTGVGDLSALGLLEPLRQGGGAPVNGFAVFPEARESTACVLPYAEVPGLRSQGWAVDRGAIGERLLAAVEELPHVRVWRGARVSGVEIDRPDSVRVTISQDGNEQALRARLVVGADGATSRLRRMAGIGETRVQIARMVGYLLRGSHLPQPGFGNVFLDGPAPTLAYETGNDAVRVMFDIPASGCGPQVVQQDPAYLAAIPEPFRHDVRQAIDTQAPLACASYSVVPHVVAKGRVVLVGDAAGCCHPLTATGLSVCTRDALRLRQALREANGDIPAALSRYVALRAGPDRTRRALADALYAAFSASTPEMRLLRGSILWYWRHSPRGRAVSMALLTTHEGRMSVLAFEYARVVGHALTELAPWSKRSDASAFRARSHAALRLTRTTLHRVSQALWSP